MNKKIVKKYITPRIKTDKVSTSFFTPFGSEMGPLLATCSCTAVPGGHCIGDTCPSGCSCSCFLPGTMVKLSSGEKEIENVKVGDKIFSYDLTLRRTVINTVEKIFIHNNINSYLVINKKIRVTPEHFFWLENKNAWIKAAQLKKEDLLLTDLGNTVKVSSIETIDGVNVTVYNLHTEEEQHNYFAEGILVHNWK